MAWYDDATDVSLGKHVIGNAYRGNSPPPPGIGHAPKLANGQPYPGTPPASGTPAAAPGTPGMPNPYAAPPGGGTARNNHSATGHVRGGAMNGSAWLPPGDKGGAGDGAGANPYGSQSGPGILENWFNERANGTDPAYEYAMKRGMESLGNRSSAAGSFNSGAARQQESDFAANMGAQRLGQLDSLAGGASGEHQNRLNSMFGQGLGLAGGESGVNTAYDLAGGKAMSDALSALLGYTTNKSGVDSQSNNQGYNNILKGLAVL